jgi:hypothetical protein
VQNDKGGSIPGIAYDASKVARIHLRIGDVIWKPVAEVTPPSIATFTDLVIGARDAGGFVTITFNASVQPPTPLRNAVLGTIVRDAAGRIVSGGLTELSPDSGFTPAGGRGHANSWIPPSVPGVHAEIYLLPNKL